MNTMDMAIIILSCDSFSDLWDGQVSQMEKYWSDRCVPTYIVTETIERNYENVKTIAVGAGVEFSDRIKKAVQIIDKPYFFVTLDDYFLREPVDDNRIQELIRIMEKDNVDYIRLYKRPMRAQGERIKKYKDLFLIKNEVMYSVNLCVGIFKREFLLGALEVSMNPWQLEVSLCSYATKQASVCYVSRANEYVILDVVRKGKILNKANRYFKKNGIYYGTREVQSKVYEFKLGVRTLLARHMPLPIVRLGKMIMKKMGKQYYSD